MSRLGVCTIEGCASDVRCRGLCSKHYGRWRAHGENLYTHPSGRRVCRSCRSEYSRQWFAGDRERISEVRASWRARNPDKSADYVRRRKARRLGAYVEDVDRQVVYERDEATCGICDTQVHPDDFEVDHIVPLSRGGVESYANIQASHRVCNRWKSDRLPDELPELPAELLEEVV